MNRSFTGLGYRAPEFSRTSAFCQCRTVADFRPVCSLLVAVCWCFFSVIFQLVPTLALHRYVFHTGGAYTPHFRYDSGGPIWLSCYSALHTGRGSSLLFKYGAEGNPFSHIQEEVLLRAFSMGKWDDAQVIALYSATHAEPDRCTAGTANMVPSGLTGRETSTGGLQFRALHAP